MALEMRADAHENRQRILAVAADALEGDSAVSLNAIAKRAGVGPGTLYRHFPDREALVMAVYRHDVTELVASAEELLVGASPVDALRTWCLRLGRFGLVKHGLTEVLRATTSEQLHGESYGPVVRALDTILGAGARAGALRSDIAPEELLLVLGFLWRLEPGPDWEDRAGILLDVVIAGLEARD
ncbi:TetR/AcrR family transcriptional regulator [Cellulomonas sp. P22]|uniref:TetR/AcrR family transcriptional regulator n=1 Tax=Cellulomonas sp. P22 TaxID=3373189 RepID=UPI0037932E82